MSLSLSSDIHNREVRYLTSSQRSLQLGRWPGRSESTGNGNRLFAQDPQVNSSLGDFSALSAIFTATLRQDGLKLADLTLLDLNSVDPNEVYTIETDSKIPVSSHIGVANLIDCHTRSPQIKGSDLLQLIEAVHQADKIVGSTNPIMFDSNSCTIYQTSPERMLSDLKKVISEKIYYDQAKLPGHHRTSADYQFDRGLRNQYFLFVRDKGEPVELELSWSGTYSNGNQGIRLMLRDPETKQENYMNIQLADHDTGIQLDERKVYFAKQNQSWSQVTFKEALGEIETAVNNALNVTSP